MHVVVCVVPPSGLSISDRPGSQPLGIGLTIIGVVVLDFCADASEGPIRAYLLDVADTDEQDMALNIHAFSAGKTPKTYKLLWQCFSLKKLLLFPWQHPGDSISSSTFSNMESQECQN